MGTPGQGLSAGGCSNLGTSLELVAGSVSSLIVSLLRGVTNGLDFMVLFFLLTAIALLHFVWSNDRIRCLFGNEKHLFNTRKERPEITLKC